MAATDEDRTEEATPTKLREAHKRGQVFKSAEVNSLVILASALAVAVIFGEWTINGVLKLAQDILGEAGRQPLTIAYVTELMHWIGLRVLYLLSPLLLLTVSAGILSNLMQTGPVFSTHPLGPDFSKLNPAQGWKRVFSLRSLYEGAKTLIKFVLLFAVGYGVIRHLLPEMFSLLQKPMSAYPATLLHLAAFALAVMLAAYSLVAFSDAAYTKREYRKNMRMSRRERREEIRRNDGDPKIRSRRRDLLLSMRKNVKSLSKVGESDVVITNPTHLAVALRYEPKTMRAPIVLSKGAGDLAMKIRELAYRHGVTVIESPALARRLFKEVALDQAVPEDTYPQIATLLRPIFDARKARREDRP